MAQRSHRHHSADEPMAPHEIHRLGHRETIRHRAALHTRETGNMLLNWSVPLILTALVFAAVIVWFWLAG